MRIAAGLLLTAGPLWGGRLSPSLDGYTSRVWHTHDGLPEDTIQALAQSPDGYLWIGTTGGLVRFDGMHFTVFNRENTPTFRENSISALLVAKDGSLWIGTQGGGLLRYRDGAFRAYGEREGIANPYICAIYQSTAGVLWIGSEWGLFRLEGDRFTQVDNRAGMRGMQVRGMAEDRQGRMWFAGTGLVAYGSKPVEYLRPRPGSFFRSVLVGLDGTVWAGSVTGLESMSPGSQTFQKVSPQRRPIETLMEDHAGNLWIGTVGDGLIRHRNGEAESLSAPETLPDNQIYAALEDTENNLWFGTGNGLLRLSPQSLSRVTTGRRSPDDNVRTTYVDSAATFWATTASGRAYQLRGGELVPAALPPEVQGLDILNVFREHDGALWFGTNGSGAIRSDQAGIRRFTSGHGLANDFIRAFCQGNDGAVWIGTNGGLTRVRDGKADVFHPLRGQYGPGFRGLPFASIRALLADTGGDVWIGTDGGLARFHEGVFVDDPVVQKIRGLAVWSLYQDTQGDIWVGSRGDGLFQVHGGQVRQFTTQNGLPSNIIYAILGDAQGSLWLSSPSGVFATTRSGLHQPAGAPLAGIFTDVESGQLAGGIQPAGAMVGGDIWLPSTTGVVRMTSGPRPRKPLPPVLIEEVVADGRRQPITGRLRLDPGHGELEIHYTVVRLSAPEAIRFRYRLEGFDSGWVDAQHQRVARYTNLSPGNYTFRVQAYDASAPAATVEAALPVTWRPHFYQSVWLYAVCAAGLLLMAYLVHNTRLRRERLNFQAVLAERGRLAREMHDTLVQGCVGALTLLQAAGSVEAQSPEKARDLVGRARDQVRSTIDEARRTIWNLRHADDSAGLYTRLSGLALSMGTDAAIPIEVRQRGTAVRLERGAEEEVVLVVREAVRNAVRHASATGIRLDVQYRWRSIRIQVSDDGCGFVHQESRGLRPRDVVSSLRKSLPYGRGSASEPRASASGPGIARNLAVTALVQDQGHYGILGMRERVEQMGGRFELRSDPGKGTVVDLNVPLKRLRGEPS